MLRFFKGFLYAARGLRHTVVTQLNFRVHLLAMLLVFLAGWYFQVSRMEWVAIVICVFAVFAAELANTAIEALVDLVSPTFNPKAGLAKDIAAGMVLVTAVMAVIVALIIFVPKILSLNVA